jgi:hypothetical protein
MALRSFTDSQGQGWRVWNVVPQYDTARDEDTLTPGLQGGWLCFEGDGHKRRLSPIPEDWEEAGPEHLERYCREATPVARRQPAEGVGTPAGQAG